MKSFILKSRFLFLFAAMILFANTSGHAKGTATTIKTLQLSDAAFINNYITSTRFGITPTQNLKGAHYQIVNEQGRVVYSGKINSTKTFYVSASKLGSGISTLYINGVVMRQFIIA